jgi:hypothetical protein
MYRISYCKNSKILIPCEKYFFSEKFCANFYGAGSGSGVGPDPKKNPPDPHNAPNIILVID